MILLFHVRNFHVYFSCVTIVQLDTDIHFATVYTVYKSPFLLVYCECGLEVYDVNTAKWIQTLPIRKVSVCVCVWWTEGRVCVVGLQQVCCPMLLCSCIVSPCYMCA